jgi:hypothetical protein
MCAGIRERQKFFVNLIMEEVLMRTKRVMLLGVPLLLSMFVATEVFAGSFGSSGKKRNKSGGNMSNTGGSRVGNAPEPVSCALLLAGGATLAALRRWKKKGLKDTDNQLPGESGENTNLS